jgi:hypothetical protein
VHSVGAFTSVLRIAVVCVNYIYKLYLLWHTNYIWCAIQFIFGVPYKLYLLCHTNYIWCAIQFIFGVTYKLYLVCHTNCLLWHTNFIWCAIQIIFVVTYKLYLVCRTIYIWCAIQIIFVMTYKLYLLWHTIYICCSIQTHVEALHCVSHPPVSAPSEAQTPSSAPCFASHSTCSSLIVPFQVLSRYTITNIIVVYINTLIANKLHQCLITGLLHTSATACIHP